MTPAALTALFTVQAAAPEGSSPLAGSPGFHHPRLAARTFRQLLCSIKAYLIFYVSSVARSDRNVKQFPHKNAESDKPVKLPALYRIKAATCRAKASSIRSRWGSVIDSVAIAARVK